MPFSQLKMVEQESIDDNELDYSKEVVDEDNLNNSVEQDHILKTAL